MKDIPAATIKKALAKKTGYMKATFSYSNQFLLPHEDALLLLKAMAHAETYNTDDYSNPKVTPLERDKYDLSFVSEEDYLDMKLATLLDIDSSLLTKSRLNKDKEDGTDG